MKVPAISIVMPVYNAEDYRLWADMVIAGLRFANIPEVLLKYRMLESQNTTRYSSEMTPKRDLIQSEYIEFIMEKLIEEDESLFDFIDNSIEFFNAGILSFSSLRHIVFDIYRNHLRNIRQNNKIKLLFCIDTLGGGGAEKLLIDILQHFDYDKYCVDLLVLIPDGIYFTDVPNQVNWFTLEDKENLNDSYDIEVAFLEGLALKYIAHRQSEAKKVVWTHTNLVNNHWSKQFYQKLEDEEFCYSRMNTIVFVSKDVKSQFNKVFPKVMIPQQVVYNLIDKNQIQRKAEQFIPEKGKLILCSIGRFTEPKGYIRLIPIVSRLINEDNLSFELWLIGEGEQREELERLIDKYSLNDIIILKGFQKNPYPYLKTADVFISTSYSEGYPLVICEAISLGRPIVASMTSGTNEILEDGKYGLLVEQDEEAIYQGLKRMITDHSLREHYSLKALERSEIFDVNESMNFIYDVLSIDNKMS